MQIKSTKAGGEAFRDISRQSLRSQKLGDMRLPTLCDLRGDSYYYGTKCGIKPTIDASISSIQIAGLDLNRC